MVSAIQFAREHDLRLAHLWRPDSPIGCPDLFEDERTGARSRDFETFFEPIPFFPGFVSGDEVVRLLYEEQNSFFHRGLNIVDETPYALAKFQHHGQITQAHLAGVDALLVLTSLNLPASPAQKVQLYRSHFAPRKNYLESLRTREKLLEGKWLAVHLRTEVRTFFDMPEWKLEDVVRETRRILGLADFDRVIVFSDSPEARAAFERHRFGRVPVRAIDWENASGVDSMFLDFLAISRATLVLSSGASSFSYEASLFGGGIPFFDMCSGLLLPTSSQPVPARRESGEPSP